jgi:CHAT domain-containing protein
MKKRLILLVFLLAISLKMLSFPVFATIEPVQLVNNLDVNCYRLEEKIDLESCKSQKRQNENLEDQAQQLYQQGDLQQSLLLLEAALKKYQAQNNKIGIIRVWRNIAFIYLKQQELQKAQTAISSSLELLEQLQFSPEQQQLYASVLEIQGQTQLFMSQTEFALETWKKAAKIYQELEKNTDFIRLQINQVQALQALGLYSKARNIIVEAEKQLMFQPDSLLKAKSLQSLGDILRELGDLELSLKILYQSLAIAESLQNPEQIAITLLSLGKTATLQNQLELASDFYQRIIQADAVSAVKIQAQLNHLKLFIEQDKFSEVLQLIPQIKQEINQIPVSKVKVDAQINLAETLMQLQQKDDSLFSLSIIAQYLTEAIKTAKLLQDQRSESYGMGLLGKLYQQNQQLESAQTVTEQALQIAQAIHAYDIAYQWQWQLGQILRSQKQPKLATKAYLQAWKNLQSLRSDIISINSEVQFNFREQVEPIYRELVDLLLSSNPTQTELKLARDVIESLQLAELDNFFKAACLDTKPINIDILDPTAAIFYTISLPDRLELIVTLPHQPLVHYTAVISARELETIIDLMQEAIMIPRERIFIENFLEPSQQLYLQLIQPFEPLLKINNIQNIVFVLDSRLRNIPIASLYDGQQYLIEKYNVAIAPSLQLIDPQPLTQKQLNVLGGGLTEARQGFSALPNVELELQQIQAQTQSEILLNENFTEPLFNREVSQVPFSVIHLATHGKFSSELEDTFILTWNEKINIEELRNLLKADAKQLNPIELLVLSACQTAAGDERAGLGLAGMAVRSGARSTIASLWSVNDESTALLMNYFYQELSQLNRTKAEALRRAQLKVLQQQDFAHPYFWAAFVLVGNWL